MHDNHVRSTAQQHTRWDTQDAAWNAIQPRIGTIDASVLASITDADGTCDDVEVRLGLTHQTCSAAVHRLMKSGAVEPAGKRPTRSGRQATVWRVAIPAFLFQGVA